VPEDFTSDAAIEKEISEMDLETLERKKVEFSEKISRAGEESKKTIAKLDQDASRVVKKISDESNAIINYHRSTSRKIIETGNSEEAKVRETVLSLASSLDFYFYTVAALLLGFGLITGYLISTISRVLLGVFALAWIILSLAILFMLRTKVAVLRSRSDDLAQLRDMQEEMTEMVSSLSQPNPDVSAFQDSIKALGSSVSDITSASSALVSSVDQAIALRSKHLGQEQLIRSFSFALSRYGFLINDQGIQMSIRKHLWTIEDHSLWLDHLINYCKQFFPNISSPIFRLAYFDAQGDRKDADQSWQVVSKAPSLRVQLASVLIRNKLIPIANIGENFGAALSELLANITNYSLDAVKVEVAAFFERLTSFKVDCVNALTLYDLSIVEEVVELMAYMPRSSQHEKWRNEVLAYIANEILHVDEVYIDLLVRDAIGDASKNKYWKLIVRSKNLPGLVTILAKKRLAGRHSEFNSTIYQRHVILVMESSPDDFELVSIEARLRELEDAILRVGKDIERTTRFYKLPLNDFSYVNSFVPKSMEAVESELLAVSAQRAQLKEDLFDLLYFTTIGSDRGNKLFKNIIESESESKILSDFLISNKFIPTGSFNQYIIPLLRIQKSLDLSNFVLDYIRYEKLWIEVGALLSFMQDKAISERNSSLSFQELLKLCPSGSPIEDQLISIATHFFIDKVGNYELSGENKEELATATAALFLFGLGDPAYKQLCQKIPFKQLASRTLYRYTVQTDQAILASEDPKLDRAIVEALELIVDDPHFDYFKSQLGSGNLPVRASNMIGRKIDDLNSEVKKLSKNGFDIAILKNYAEQMRRALHNSADEATVRSLLTKQILSAYLLTIPKNYPVGALLDSEDDFMGRSARDLATRKEKGGYDYLVKLSSGKAGRVGLVPLGMSFEVFADRFEDVLRGAVKMYNVKSQENPLPDPLPCYLSRLFPSDTTLKEIIPPGENEARPLEIIRALIGTSMSSSEALLLLATFQPAVQGRVALRSVVESLVDGSNLQTLFIDTAPTIIKQNKEIQAKFENGVVDNALLESYNVTKLSMMCKTISDQIRTTGEDRVKKRFYMVLKDALPEVSQLPSSRREALMRILFKRIKSVGAVFSP
jgi:hypothetical protein